MAFHFNDNRLISLIRNYGFINAWSSDFVTINGTVTTVHDYLGEHDLSNPDASSQPSYNSSDTNFGGRPTIEFDGISQHLRKDFSDWRLSDDTGVFISVMSDVGAINFRTVLSSGFSNGLSSVGFGTNSDKPQFIVNGFTIITNSTVGSSGTKVIALSNDGSNNKSWEDGVEVTDTTVNANWLNNYTNRDNIVMGALIRSTSNYYNGKMGFVGYLPYTTDNIITTISNKLIDIYGR